MVLSAMQKIQDRLDFMWILIGKHCKTHLLMNCGKLNTNYSFDNIKESMLVSFDDSGFVQMFKNET